MSEPRDPSPGGTFATVGVVVAAVVCCAGPVLVAVVAAAGLGGLLRNPWLIAGAVAVLVAAAGYPIARNTRHHNGTEAEDCCPPPAHTPEHADTRSRQRGEHLEKGNR